MTEFIISSEQLERIIESVEHNTGREINRVVIDGVRAREIVRCRDCRYYSEYQDLCERLQPGMLVMEADGFCAWGERRWDAD